ncbi:hypothetical protein Q9L58_005827 [Maublancomyces gigas]|uniref:UBC core domain-containing protein n=1 Tax=Discina gigas TaxID=1032678 RepID=A0ABR3GI64_9PEZI
MYTKRLNRELSKMNQSLPPGISLHSAEDLVTWQMDLQVLDNNPIYANKTFRLNFKFSNSYPIEAPEVMFVRAVDREIPIHPHVYSNGVICLDLLSNGNGWSPVQSVESVCMSIQSMLTGNTKNERPEGDAQFVLAAGRSPRDIRFVYDDPTV